MIFNSVPQKTANTEETLQIKRGGKACYYNRQRILLLTEEAISISKKEKIKGIQPQWKL